MKEEESSNDAWIYYSPITDSENYEHTSQIETDVNSNYNPYLDVSIIFETRAGTNYDDTIQTKGDNDNDIEDLDDYLVRDDAPFIINEEGERFKEKRCKLLGIPYKKPPKCKSKSLSIWKAFGGNTRDLGSLGEETNKTTDLHQISQEFLLRSWRRRHRLHVTPSQLIPRRRDKISRWRQNARPSQLSRIFYS
ncbi:hypothetical protein Tco_1020709 [Tanacetum coccineum]